MMDLLYPMTSREEYERGEETDYMSEEEYEEYCAKNRALTLLEVDRPEGLVIYFEDDIPF
jgi:hypothetical protein